MSEQRQISDSSNMDKEAENMDEIPSSPAFSINSVTTEITNIPISGIINQPAVDLDVLMHCDDLLDDEEVTCPCNRSTISEGGISTYSSSWCSMSKDSRMTYSSSWGAMSEDSRMTYSSSWCSSPNSDISEMITSFDQNIDEEITKVCQSFLNLENLKTEIDDFGEKEEVLTTETWSTSKLAIRSEDSARPASCASSSSTNTAITEAAKMLVSQVIDEAVKTLQSTKAVRTLQSTEAVKTLQSTEPVKTLQSTESVKTLQSTEPVKTLQSTEPVKTLQSTESVKILQSTEPVKTLQSTEPVKTLQSTESVKTLQSTEPVKTLQSTEPVKTLQSTEPVKTLQSTESVKILQSTEPVKTLVATEAVKTLVATEAVKALEATEAVKTLEATEAVKALEATEAVKTLEATEAVKTLQSTEAVKTLEATEAVKTLLSTEAVKTLQSTEPVKTLQSTEPVKTLAAKTVTDFQEDVRSSLSRQSRDSCDGVLKDFPPGPSEDDGHLAFSQEDKADWQHSSTITSLIRTFFQSLSEEQWSEVSEGVYNQDVREQLTDMCTNVLRFISESVAKNILQAIRQGQGSTSGTLTLRSPLSSAPLTEYFGITEYNMQRNLESSFSQALCNVIGADTPGRISPKFTEAIAGEVISVLSAAIQVSMDGGSSSVTAATSFLVSKDRAAKKTLEGAITTMKSFLTARSTAVKRRIQTGKGLDHDSKEETLAGGCKGKTKKSQWRRCFSGWRRKKIQPVPLEHLDEAVRSASTDLTSRSIGESKQGSRCSQEKHSTTSSSALVELVDYMEDKDETTEDTRNGVSSLSSPSSIPPDHQVTWSKCLEDPPIAEATTDEFQEEMSTSLSHQSTDSGDEDDETFSQSSVEQSQPDSEYLSNNQVDVEETKAKKSNHVFRFFCNIFSKNEKKMNKEKEKKKKASAENQTKHPPFWMQLLCCSSCSCCLDK